MMSAPVVENAMTAAPKLTKILKQCRIDKPRHFRLADHDPAERAFSLENEILAMCRPHT